MLQTFLVGSVLNERLIWGFRRIWQKEIIVTSLQTREKSFVPFTESKGFITEKMAKKSLKFVHLSQSENSFDFCQHT